MVEELIGAWNDPIALVKELMSVQPEDRPVLRALVSDAGDPDAPKSFEEYAREAELIGTTEGMGRRAFRLVDANGNEVCFPVRLLAETEFYNFQPPSRFGGH